MSEKSNSAPATDKAALEDAVAKGTVTLEQRIMGVMEDVVNTKIAALEKALDEKIDGILKSKEIEMEQALRKGFGLENDPVIHESDLIAALRKASLAESGDVGKRTPAPAATAKSGEPKPADQKSDNPFEAKLKAFEQEAA
jgi:hypothetical protein